MGSIKRVVSFRLEDDFCGIDIMSTQEIVRMGYIRILEILLIFVCPSPNDYLNIPIKDVDLCFTRGLFLKLDSQGIDKILRAVSNVLAENAILFLSEIEDLSFFDNLPLTKKEIDLRQYYIYS